MQHIADYYVSKQTHTQKKFIFSVISYKTGIHVKEIFTLNVICGLTAYKTFFPSWIITVCIYIHNFEVIV